MHKDTSEDQHYIFIYHFRYQPSAAEAGASLWSWPIGVGNSGLRSEVWKAILCQDLELVGENDWQSLQT